MEDSASAEEIRHVPVDGARIVVQTKGSGLPAVVLVHGLAGDRTVWDFLWDDLAAERQVVAYDLRGFGESVTSAAGEFRHAQDLESVLDAVGAKQCDLVGLSLGGSIALNFALDHPFRVRRLALVSPLLTGWEWSAEWRTRWEAITEASQARDLERVLRLWSEHPLFAGTRHDPVMTEKIRRSLEAHHHAAPTPSAREALALPDLDRLPTLDMPTLLLTGGADLEDFRTIAAFIATAAPDVRRIDYDGAGHMLHLERPKEVREEIRRFLLDRP